MNKEFTCATLAFTFLLMTAASAAYPLPAPESPFNPDQDWIQQMRQMAV